MTAQPLLPVVAVLSLVSCGGQPPVDPFCSTTALAPGADIKPGQGALQVEGTTTPYFYVNDENGKQIGYQSLNRTLGLNPGKYHVRVNNSSHTVAVQKGSLTKCSTGTLMVSGTTSEYYYVKDSANKDLSYHTLGQAASFFPSPLRVKVNNTEAQAEVKLDQVTEIKTGTLVVRGSTNEYYYVSDALGKELNYGSLEKPLAFLPGAYAVRVNKTETKADIIAGQVTELRTGALLVKGATDEYYYVADPLGKELNYQGLNKALSFFPGKLRIRVNKTEAEAEVVAGQAREYVTGSLVVTGSGSDYYYVSDKSGNSLNYGSLNKALSFFPAEYNVKLGQSSRTATVTPGQTVSVNF